jgi:hypothetical protein
MLVRDLLPRAAWSEAVEGSGGAPAAEAAPAAPVSNDPAVEKSTDFSAEIKSIFEFDPFADNTLNAETPPAPAPAPVVAEPPAPVTPPAPDPLQSTVQALQDTVQALPEAVRQAVQPAPAAPPPVDDYHPRDGDQMLNYVQIMSQVPDVAIQGLVSENPLERKQALAQVLGVAMHVTHRLAAKQAVEQLRSEFSRVLPAYVHETMQSETTRREVHNDFYTKFPQLNHPVLKQVVMREAATLAPKLGVKAWTPEFRDSLGAHVMNMLPQMAAPAAPAMAQATPTVGPSARPMNGTGARTQQQDIADLLFGR